MDAYTMRHLRPLPGHLHYAQRHLAYYGHDPYNNHKRFAAAVAWTTPYDSSGKWSVLNLPEHQVM